ncbi:uncharacterized protein ACN2A1_011996 [Glossina fuscipes fuscipes]
MIKVAENIPEHQTIQILLEFKLLAMVSKFVIFFTHSTITDVSTDKRIAEAFCTGIDLNGKQRKFIHSWEDQAHPAHSLPLVQIDAGWFTWRVVSKCRTITEMDR